MITVCENSHRSMVRVWKQHSDGWATRYEPCAIGQGHGASCRRWRARSPKVLDGWATRYEPCAIGQGHGASGRRWRARSPKVLLSLPERMPGSSIGRPEAAHAGADIDADDM